jgi:hypothetical protein
MNKKEPPLEITYVYVKDESISEEEAQRNLDQAFDLLFEEI